MTNPSRNLNKFACFKNRVFQGYVQASTEQQAHERAAELYGRCEVMTASLSRALKPRGRVRRADSSFTHGRSPYAVGDFEARRAAAIAAWKAEQA